MVVGTKELHIAAAGAAAVLCRAGCMAVAGCCMKAADSPEKPEVAKRKGTQDVESPEQEMAMCLAGAMVMDCTLDTAAAATALDAETEERQNGAGQGIDVGYMVDP